MIVNELDAVSYCIFKLVCKDIDMWIKDPPKLSAAEWQRYHSILEARGRRKLQSLSCAGCKRILDRRLFTDAAAREDLDNGRLCISCEIQEGVHDTRSFTVDKEVFFGCRGCRKAKPLDELDKCLENVARWWEKHPRTKQGLFRASRKCRWCHSCWDIIQNYRKLDQFP